MPDNQLGMARLSFVTAVKKSHLAAADVSAEHLTHGQSQFVAAVGSGLSAVCEAADALLVAPAPPCAKA